VSYDGEVKARWDVIAKMTETMALRGPDAKGIFIDRHRALMPIGRANVYDAAGTSDQDNGSAHGPVLPGMAAGPWPLDRDIALRMR
jgi:asparagine synthetase B (glutamine-hydrolysing)